MTFLYCAALIVLLFAIAPEERRRDKHSDISWWRYK
jgi:hypothetical protein